MFKVELPEYNRSLDEEPIQEGKYSKYICEDKIKGGICAISNYKNEFEINITLADACENGIKCKLNREPNEVFIIEPMLKENAQLVYYSIEDILGKNVK